MSSKRTTLVLATAALTALALATAAQSAFGATYALQGTYATTQGGCNPETCGGATYSYDGTATCQSKCQNAPRTGDFTLRLTGQGLFPPSPCVSKRVDGQLTFFPTDPFFPPDPIIAAVQGHDVDFHGYRVSGTISAGVLAGLPVSAFVSYPPDPISPALLGCSPGTFTGTFFPPYPV